LNRLKRTAVHLALALITLWPLAQMALVRRYAVNPWKLAGWGMYSAPQMPASVYIVAHTSDAVGAYELSTLQPELQPALAEFLRARLGLGELVEPKALGRALLDYYPAIDGVSIEIVQPRLDRGSAMIEERSTTYRYDRRSRPT